MGFILAVNCWIDISDFTYKINEFGILYHLWLTVKIRKKNISYRRIEITYPFKDTNTLVPNSLIRNCKDVWYCWLMRDGQNRDSFVWSDCINNNLNFLRRITKLDKKNNKISVFIFRLLQTGIIMRISYLPRKSI